LGKIPPSQTIHNRQRKKPKKRIAGRPTISANSVSVTFSSSPISNHKNPPNTTNKFEGFFTI
jgi:hypothetical protein